MSDKNVEIWTLDEDLSLPLVAAWRILEKSLNPAISFILKCERCKMVTNIDSTQGPKFVLSKKKKKGMPVLIGIQCQTEKCGRVIKFARPVSPGDSDFPSRLQKYPSSSLTTPDGKAPKKSDMKLVEKLLDLE